MCFEGRGGGGGVRILTDPLSRAMDTLLNLKKMTNPQIKESKDFEHTQEKHMMNNDIFNILNTNDIKPLKRNREMWRFLSNKLVVLIVIAYYIMLWNCHITLLCHILVGTYWLRNMMNVVNNAIERFLLERIKNLWKTCNREGIFTMVPDCTQQPHIPLYV